MSNSLTVYFDSPDLCREFLSVLKNNSDICEKGKITVVQSNEKCVLSCDSLLIVCGKNAKYLPDILNCSNTTVILNSACRIVLSEDEAKNYKFITCGFSSKDSVTVSSITSDKSVVSIQRGFINFTGYKVEPMELVIDCSYKNCDNMLEVVTAVLYCFDKSFFENK